MKGVIITSGFGKRMWPTTEVCPKIFHLIYDKPTIFYNLSLLLDMGITNIGIVGTPSSNTMLKSLLDEKSFGANINYIDENCSTVSGTASSLEKAKEFVDGNSFVLFLGDSLFIDTTNRVFLDLQNQFKTQKVSLTISVPVYDARPYAYFENGYAVEKGKDKTKNTAIPGFYIFDSLIFDYLPQIKKSKRGEFEIISAVNLMIKDKKFVSAGIEDSIIWLDTGTPDTLLTAANLIRSLQNVTGKLLGSPHLEALANELITKDYLLDYLKGKKGQYAVKLREIISK